MMRAETQKNWGWIIAVYIFSAGLGGGAFLLSYILDMLNLYGPVVRIVTLMAPLLVLLGTIFLLADLGSVKNSYRLFITPSTLKTSWIARGAWILTAFIILGLAYALPSFDLFKWLPWSHLTSLGQGIGAVAALLAIIVTIYPGLLFGVLRSIPFWNNSTLPLLFFLSGLDTGIGLLVLVSLFNPGNSGPVSLQLLDGADMVVIPLLLITLGLYIYIVRQSGTAARLSIRALKNPLFIGGVIIAGILIPLILLIYSAFLTDIRALRILAGLTGGLTLIGGFCLRYSVIKSGINQAEVEL